jgi:hypothetical protein
MVRLLAFLAVVAGIGALLGRGRVRAAALAVLCLAVLYAVLKLAGVIDAAFPDRAGVF